MNFNIINSVSFSMMYIYVCLCTYLQKCTTPGKDADVKSKKKQTDSFKSVYILYAFGWFL
jgi:hypothetical protein